ncbi:Nucleoside-binding protein [Lactococcus lactis subsp. lactis]|uniref:Nucleoside-binding protein n=1 Tax=Lactococcus lactis subsp. lactis TaxID=1360 RepID=A0A0V8D7U5_LACLL|nr:hypothetical protein [Lactococcus lactis]KSU09668.1 Nucleoside-binding protein [Lactococcus lactis subsp. lactis]
MNKRIVTTSLILISGLSILAGCRSNGTASRNTKTDVKVAVVTDASGINDRSFN